MHCRSAFRCLTNSRRFLNRSSRYLASFLGGACPITFSHVFAERSISEWPYFSLCLAKRQGICLVTLSRLLARVSVAPKRSPLRARKRVLSVELASLAFSQSQGGLCLSSAPAALGCAGRLQLGQLEHDLPRSQLATTWRPSFGVRMQPSKTGKGSQKSRKNSISAYPLEFLLCSHIIIIMPVYNGGPGLDCRSSHSAETWRSCCHSALHHA